MAIHLQPRPCFNLLSAFTPLLGVVFTIVVVCIEALLFNEHPMHSIKTAGMAYGVALLFGFVSGGIALVRGERLWGITVLGLVLNAPFVLIVMWAPWDLPF
jgi:hypothetical protein